MMNQRIISYFATMIGRDLNRKLLHFAAIGNSVLWFAAFFWSIMILFFNRLLTNSTGLHDLSQRFQWVFSDSFWFFYWIELNFNKFHHTSTGWMIFFSNHHSWVFSFNHTRVFQIFFLDWLGFTGFYRILRDYTGFYWVLPSCTRFYWVLLGSTGFYRVLMHFPQFHWVFT